MKYTWDKKLLWKLWQNPQTRQELELLYKSYFGLLMFDQDLHMSTKGTIADDTFFFLENNFLETLLMDFAYKSNVKNLPDNGFSEKIKSKDEIMQLTNDFYRSLEDDTIRSIFAKLYEQRFTHLRFTSVLNSMSFAGYTFYSSNANETFISVDFTKTLANVFSLVHEYGHAIWDNARQEEYCDISDNMFCEIESIFMELLAFDYIEKNYPKYAEDAKTARFNCYDNALCDMDILLYKNDFSKDIIHLEKDFGDLSNTQLIHFLKNKWQLTTKDMIKIFRIPAYAICPYPIGTLIAIELYYIYQKDPQEALKIYKELMLYKFKSNYEFFTELKKMGITPSEHIDAYERTLSLR